MPSAVKQLQRRRKARRTIDDIFDRAGQVNIIHYSCESFYDRPDGSSPRITSIAVRNLESGQTKSFSIHQMAERHRYNAAQLENHYDELECEMLAEFFEFTSNHTGYWWLHWNMRDINYGFAAIEHRCRVLGCNPVVIPESQRFDLARLLIDLFGTRYASHPRLEKLVAKNRMSTLQFLSGAAEAKAFEDGEYVKLHQSTLKKVDVMANIVQRTWNGSLKTEATWRDQYGSPLIGVVEAATDHWLFKLLGLVGILVTLGTALSALLQ